MDLWRSAARHSLDLPVACSKQRKRLLKRRVSLHCVDEFEGTLKWKFDATNDLSDPAVAYGQVYISSGAFVYCLDETYGHIVWKADLSDRAETNVGTPSVADGKIFVSAGVMLFCLDVENGAIVWT